MITSNLLPRLLGCSILHIELTTRLSWWINHPQAFSKLGTSNSLNSISISSPLVDCIVFGGMGREPKKTPPLRLPSLARVCGYPIHPNLFIARGIPMIYSYLVGPKGSILSNISRPRIIRFKCGSNKDAKAALNGLPAALISRIPNGRAI